MAKLIFVNWFLPFTGAGLFSFSFTNEKFKVSLHAINRCCGVGFLNTR